MQSSQTFASKRTGWIVCTVIAISVFATVWSTLILFRTIDSNRRTTASLFPLLAQSESFEREILNARIEFIYHVTMQKPGSLERGLDRYGRAQADLESLQREAGAGPASVLLKPRKESLDLAWQAYDHRLRATLALVADGVHSGSEYNRQVSQWAADGDTLVNTAHDFSDLIVALTRAQSSSTAFFLRLALIIVNANGTLWLLLGASYFWGRSRSLPGGSRAASATLTGSPGRPAPRTAFSRVLARSRLFYAGFSAKACVAVAFMLASVGVVLGTGLFALRGIERLTSAQSGSMHSQQVLIDAESLKAFSSGVESDTRGFVFSGRPSLLISQQNDMRSAWDRFNTLSSETTGDAKQRWEIRALHESLQHRFEWLDYISSVRQQEGAEAVASLLANGNNLSYKQDLENALARLESTQYELLAAGALDSEHAAVVSKTLILFAAFPASLGLGILGVVTVHLLTRGTRLQGRLRRLNATLQAVLGTAPVAIASFGSAAELQFWNAAAEELFSAGRASGSALSVTDAPAELGDLVQRLEKSFGQNADADSTTSLRVQWPAPNGEARTLQVSAARVQNGEDGQHGMVAIAQDMTEQLRLQEQLAFQANHDVLTGLPNRLSLDARFERMLGGTDSTPVRCAVFGIDLDHFKQVNDRYGHGVGDIFLRKVTERLASVLRQSDTLVRVGGDEFLCLSEGLHDAHDAEVIAERLVGSLARPIEVEGVNMAASVSIGIAVYPEDASDAEELRKRADAALYRAKTSGRNLFCRFEQNEAEKRKQLIQECLQTALQQNRFRLAYQPQYTAGGALRGFEALLRFEHPSLGPVSPVEFIPLAEKSRLIVAIGAWVLEEACATYAGWQQQGLAPGILAVNVSACQFARRDFSEQVVRSLHGAQLQPGCLELELTESMVMSDPGESDRQMRRLEQAGVRLAIDDFGTGYSSLSHLNRLPINTLKIDRTFIHQLGSGNTSRSIIEAIVGLGKALSMEVIAEGVETEDQRACVAALGCDHLQGFLFAKPLERVAVEALLKGNLCREAGSLSLLRSGAEMKAA